MGFLWIGASVVTYSLFLQAPTDTRILWIKMSLVSNALIATSIMYVTYANIRSTLTRKKMERVLTPAVLLGGLVWGTVPILAGPESIGVIYLCITILFIFCFLVYFLVFGYWWLGHIFALLLIIGIEASDLSGAGYLNIKGIAQIVRSPENALPNRFIAPLYLATYSLLMVILAIGLNYISLLLQTTRLVIQNQHDTIKLLLHEFEEGAQDWIWETDKFFRLTYVPSRMIDAAACETSINGKPLPELFRAELKSSQTLMQLLQKHTGFRNIVVTLTHKKAPSHWSLSGRPVFSESHEFLGYRGIGSDVTNEISIKETEIARQRYDTIISMTGSIAHDFNNLAASIIGSLELVEFTAQHSDQEKTLIRHAMDSCLRTRDITSQLISFSKLDMALRPASFLAYTEVEKVINEARPTINQGVTINIDGDNTQWIHADKTQFSRAVLNLIQNANNALSDKLEGGAIHISVDTDIQHKNMLTVMVSDNGRGIPEYVIPRIFDPFYTTRKESGGSGLGLSMAQGFARQSGGDLTVSCEHGKTLFNLTLPQGKGHNNLAVESSEAKATSCDGLKVLVLEDDKHVELVLRKTLKSLGLTVISASSINSAHQKIKDHIDEIDFILSDIMLPDGHGFDFIRKVLREKPGLPFIYMSGVSDTLPENLDPELVAPFLQKPFTRDNLMKAIKNSL